MISLHHSDCIEWLKNYSGPLFDSCVTDPPYHLASIVARFGKEGSAPCKEGATGAYARASKGFMGKEWDGGDVAFRPETWLAVYDTLKPGAHLVAFSGTRTFHRMVCAIEDAGFEVRDTIIWHYGSGFPKSHNVSKGIDKAAGVEREVIATGKAVKRIIPGADQAKAGWTKDNGREYTPTETIPATDEAAQWEGWGTALKPASELICLARKPLSEKTVAANVLKHGTGAINIDGCRIELNGSYKCAPNGRPSQTGLGDNYDPTAANQQDTRGRFPANVIHDGSDEVIAGFPDSNGQQGVFTGNEPSSPFTNIYGDMPNRNGSAVPRNDSGSAARFFYSAKAGPLDRLGSQHATIKPIDLMRWLCRLVTPEGGHILEPFAGSGTTGIAAMVEGFDCTMIEMEADHVADIERKLAHLRGEGVSSIEMHKKRKAQPIETLGGLFAEDAA